MRDFLLTLIVLLKETRVNEIKYQITPSILVSTFDKDNNLNRMELCKVCLSDFKFSRCHQCRANRRAKKSKKPIGWCRACKKLKPATSIGKCHKCTKASGFKQCSKCKEAKLLHFDFYDTKRAWCIQCISLLYKQCES